MKHTIEIEGLPEGWDIVSCRLHGIPNDSGYINGIIRLKKKQPRRIVLEETGMNSSIKEGEFGLGADGSFYRCTEPSKWGSEYSVWREVKETDLSLNNADGNESLRLSVDECKQILGYINDNNSIFLKLANFVSERKLHQT